MSETLPYRRADAQLASTASNGGYRYSAWVRVPGRPWERVGRHYASEREAEEAAIGWKICSHFLVGGVGFDPNVNGGRA